MDLALYSYQDTAHKPQDDVEIQLTVNVRTPTKRSSANKLLQHHQHYARAATRTSDSPRPYQHPVRSQGHQLVLSHHEGPSGLSTLDTLPAGMDHRCGTNLARSWGMRGVDSPDYWDQLADALCAPRTHQCQGDLARTELTYAFVPRFNRLDELSAWRGGLMIMLDKSDLCVWWMSRVE